MYQFTNLEDATEFFGEITAKSYLIAVDSRRGFTKVKIAAHDGNGFVGIGDAFEVFTDEIEKVEVSS